MCRRERVYLWAEAANMIWSVWWVGKPFPLSLKVFLLPCSFVWLSLTMNVNHLILTASIKPLTGVGSPCDSHEGCANGSSVLDHSWPLCLSLVFNLIIVWRQVCVHIYSPSSILLNVYTNTLTLFWLGF